ncbi:hypothetical protein WN944_020200 [Citrus x changshan-huyou]|uniref:Uncharacterized protein n=1 Tax=Citrus x changshan-huyou TaxID=2935761 RepID=A0AAP0QFV5_9ROSI
MPIPVHAEPHVTALARPAISGLMPGSIIFNIEPSTPSLAVKRHQNHRHPSQDGPNGGSHRNPNGVRR